MTERAYNPVCPHGDFMGCVKLSIIYKPNKKEIEMFVANKILEHLGGSRFQAMTGAKNFVSDGSSLSFKLPKCRNGINYVSITLCLDDTYSIFFQKILRNFSVKEVSKIDDIYAEDLCEVFTGATGLYTQL